MRKNWELYQNRTEPSEVRKGSAIINLRTCEDLETLSALERVLRQYGEDAVLMPWISRPFGHIEGYGVYHKKEAEEIQKRAHEEKWGDPFPAQKYDLGWFRERAELLTDKITTMPSSKNSQKLR